MFVLDFQPFSTVEDKGFRNFVKELNPGYTLPARKTISKTYILALYEKCLSETKKLAQDIRKICITTDC
nr:unnamed protein product [Callosobruchus analis]